MLNSHMIMKLRQWLGSNNITLLGNWLKSDPDMYNWIIEQTCAIDGIKNLSERVYIIINGMPPYCSEGNKRQFNTFSKGYRAGCVLGNKCKCVSKLRISNQRITLQKKYGMEVTNANLIPGILQKTRETNLRNLGVEYPAQSKIVQEKRAETLANRTESQKQETFNKTKMTMIEKYGVTNHMKLPEYKNKMANTNLERYQTIAPLQNPIIHAKLLASLKNIDIQSKNLKIKTTCLEKYNVTSPSRIGIPEKVLNVLDNKELFINTITNKTRKEVIEELDIAEHTLYLYAKKYNVNHLFKTMNERSNGEIELFNFIKSLCSTAEHSNKTVLYPKHLDIYIRELGIAFEYCGLYWHNESMPGKDKKYHYDKYLKCKELGIKLITIFEDEWLYSTELVKQRIIHLLQQNVNKIYARKCSIIECSNEQTNDFIIKHHVQGNVPSKIKLGLIYNNEIVALMTLGTPRFNKKYQWELLRFCTKGMVIGAASKLLNFFIKQYSPETIISYSDNRWGNGQVYQVMGFEKIKETIGFYYTDLKKRFNRQQFQKHKITNESNNTATNIMLEQGYYRIWDCGQSQWLYSNKS